MRGQGEGIGEGAASVTEATPGFKGSERGAEARPHVAGSESPERAQERLLMKVQLRSSTDPNIPEMVGPWMIAKKSSKCRMLLA